MVTCALVFMPCWCMHCTSHRMCTNASLYMSSCAPFDTLLLISKTHVAWHHCLSLHFMVSLAFCQDPTWRVSSQQAGFGGTMCLHLMAPWCLALKNLPTVTAAMAARWKNSMIAWWVQCKVLHASYQRLQQGLRVVREVLPGLKWYGMSLSF